MMEKTNNHFFFRGSGLHNPIPSTNQLCKESRLPRLLCVAFILIQAVLQLQGQGVVVVLHNGKHLMTIPITTCHSVFKNYKRNLIIQVNTSFTVYSKLSYHPSFFWFNLLNVQFQEDKFPHIYLCFSAMCYPQNVQSLECCNVLVCTPCLLSV